MDEKDNPRSKQYDRSWDSDDFDEDGDFDESEEEITDDDDDPDDFDEGEEEGDDPFDRKMEQWEKRDWQQWLKQYASFPFTATREEDMDANQFSDEDDDKPFAVGTKMIVFELGYNDFHEAVLAHVKQGKEKGWVPLADLEVTPKSDPNYRAVREYVAWFANR